MNLIENTAMTKFYLWKINDYSLFKDETTVVAHYRHLRILSKVVHWYNTINPFEFATYRKQLFLLVLSLDFALCLLTSRKL